MKIVISTNDIFTAYNHRADLMRTLREMGHEIIVVAKEDEYKKSLLEQGYKYVPIDLELKGKNPFKEFALISKYKEVYDRIEPDYILQFTIKPNIYGTLASKDRSYKCINNVTGLGETFLSKGLTNKIVRFLYKRSFKHADIVFFQNRDDRQLFIDGKLVNTEKTDLLPGSGVNLEKFTTVSQASRDEKIFILIGRLISQKGHREYYQAAKKIKEKYSNVKFQILGHLAPGKKNSIELEEINRWEVEGIIDYLGVSNDVRKEIGNATCVVLPSYYREGVPKTLIESSAMGKPLITTNNVGCKEIIIDYINGFKIPVRDTEALYKSFEKIINLDESELKHLENNSRLFCEKRYDSKFVIEKYLQYIK